MLEEKNQSDIIEFTAEIVTAYVSNNSVSATELPALIAEIHASLSGLLIEQTALPAEKPIPAVPVKKSMTDDYIICLEDGKKFKSLKRHLMSHYGMTPEEYRAKWDLPADYPMVAPNYAATRSNLAKQMGLGRKAKAAEATKGRRKAA
jgi:predicted transcriptional regulator